MKEIGRKTLVGIGKETTFGTKASSISYFPVESFDPSPRAEIVREQGMFGRKESTLKGACVAKKFAEPSFSGIVYDEIIGELLMAALGTDTKTGSAVPYTHTFTSNNTSIPSYTIVWKSGNMTKMLTGCVLTTLSLVQETGAFLNYSASFISKYPATTTETPGISAENKFCSKYATLKLADDVAGLSGASAINAETFNWTIEKNVESLFVFGSDEPADNYDKQMDNTGDFTLGIDDDSYLTLHENGTIKAMQFETVNSDVAIGTGNPELKVVFDAVDVSEWTRGGGKDDRTTQTCGFVASYDLGSSSEITVTLKNSQSTDY